LGDCNGRGAPRRLRDAEIVTANLLDGEQRRVSARVPPTRHPDPRSGRVRLTGATRASGRRCSSASAR
jgi:hypothetical protein